MAAAGRVAILGGGATAAWLVLRLLRLGVAGIDVVEPRPVLGRGLAYSTADEAHLLNVPASKMDLHPEPGDPCFSDWLAGVAPTYLPDGYAPRRLYGVFLEEALRAACRGRDVVHHATRAMSLERHGDGFRIGLAEGEPLHARAVVLALGNLPPRRLAPGLADGRIVEDPWALPCLPDLPVLHAAHVLVAGTGLTALDAVLSLSARMPRARFTLCAGRPILPAVDRIVEPWPHGETLVGLGPAAAWRTARRAVHAQADATEGWYGVVDGIRPHVEHIWEHWSTRERRSFWRHGARHWLHRRHRIPPATFATISRMAGAGRVELRPGRASGVRLGEDGVLARVGGEELSFDLVVNATGPSLSMSDEPLLRSAVEAGLVAADPLGLGIRVDRDGRIVDRLGTAAAGLYALGPLTRGRFFEIVAVPHIRVKAGAIALALASAGTCDLCEPAGAAT